MQNEARYEDWKLRFISIMCLIPIILFSIGLDVANSANQKNAQAVQNQVDLELVLAIDTSTSVDNDEYALQQIGLAQAFLHRQVIDAILSTGKYGVAVSVVHWAGENRQATVVEWSILRNELDASMFSSKIYAANRRIKGQTDIGGAISYSVASLETNGIEGFRRTIDVSGDGAGNALQSAMGRNLALALDITVNGLVINNEDIDLGILAKLEIQRHYRENVIGGPGSFLMIAEDFEDFAIAIRRKLAREIRGLNLATNEQSRAR